MTLHDAIDQDVFKIDDDQFTDADFQAMPIDELETIKIRINKISSGISAAIAERKIDYANGGKGTSKEWYMRHRTALSIYQRVLTYVNNIIKKRRRAGRTVSDYFMEQAKTVLPRKDFELILSNAHQKMEANHVN